MESWSKMNDVVEREFKDEIELEFKDEIELDNLVDVFDFSSNVIDWGNDCKKRRVEKETETNDEIAVEEIFKQLVTVDSEKTSGETKASNDEIAVEEILRQFVTVDSEKTSDETEASNDEIAVEEISRQLVTVDSEKTSDETEASNDEIAVEEMVTVDSEKTSDETEASNEKMNDEETCCREKETETMDRIVVEEFYRQLVPFESEKTSEASNEKTNDEETLTDEIEKKTKQMRKERDARWRGEQDKMERAAIKTIATFVPNLRRIKKRTRLQILEDVIHHFNTCHSSMVVSNM